MALCKGWKLNPLCCRAVLSDGMVCNRCWDAKSFAATHELENDPPHELSRMGRLTCKDCGMAVVVPPGGTPYGSAVETACPGAKP